MWHPFKANRNNLLWATVFSVVVATSMVLARNPYAGTIAIDPAKELSHGREDGVVSRTASIKVPLDWKVSNVLRQETGDIAEAAVCLSRNEKKSGCIHFIRLSRRPEWLKRHDTRSVDISGNRTVLMRTIAEVEATFPSYPGHYAVEVFLEEKRSVWSVVIAFNAKPSVDIDRLAEYANAITFPE